mmetsp:Transcript_81171/g.143585  ORF Transcript_81171/g.143585 Transcript_81171/m.143585 type:complete len:487 (-) Transcript_81171:18-1478(-)
MAAVEEEEEHASDPFQTINSDGEELALAIPKFDSSDDEGFDEDCADQQSSLQSQQQPLQERFACSLQKLRAVRRHNHRDRCLSDLSPGSLAPDPELAASGGPLPRIDISKMSVADFGEQFTAASQPAMILGALEGCGCLERWSSRENILEHYGEMPFKVSEIAAPFPGAQPLKVELPLQLYIDEVAETCADFPFYVFERDLSGPRAKLLEDFEVPSYFRDDLYDITEYTRAFFPLYRYVIVGPERTGSNLHVDPSCTSAWNTLLSGVKRWALFPPGDSDEYRARIGAPPRSGWGGDAPPPAYWWLDVLPKLKSSGAAEDLGLVECVQRPGETIYVPYGWWHCVLNLGFTTAVTQNLVAPESLPLVWDDLEASWPKFAPEFAQILKQHRPGLQLPAAAEAAAERFVASTRVESQCETKSNGHASENRELKVDLMTAPSPLCCAPLSKETQLETSDEGHASHSTEMSTDLMSAPSPLCCAPLPGVAAH